MELHDWLPIRCWVCQASDFEDKQELKIPQKQVAPLTSNLNFDDNLAPESLLSQPQQATSSTQNLAMSPRKGAKEEERQQLREQMKVFVSRAMAGVLTEVLDEASQSLKSASFHIDDRLEHILFSGVPADATALPDRENLTPIHHVPIAKVIEVLRASDAKSRFAEGAMANLSQEQMGRLVLIVYNGIKDGFEELQQVCFLETSAQDMQNFMTCIRILRRYMDDRASRAVQISC